MFIGKSLDELKSMRDQLDAEIDRIEADRDKFKRDQELKLFYVRVVCPSCRGLGGITMGGADRLSDPRWEDICEDCSGQGFLHTRLFDEGGKRKYDLTYNEVYAG